MKRGRLILRSLWHYRRSHLGVFLGTILTGAVLTGALLVGESVRFSLHRLTLLRLGSIRVAVSGGDRFVTAGLADRLSRKTGDPVAAVLEVPGIASAGGGTSRVNGVRILGIDAAFGHLAPGGSFPPVPKDDEEAVLGEKLALRLGVGVGDDILLRPENPGAMPSDAPLSGESGGSIALRVRVTAVAGDDEFGRFSLRANHTAPYNAFVSREALAAALDLTGKANLLLVGSSEPGVAVADTETGRYTGGTPDLLVHEALDQALLPEDASLKMRPVREGTQLEILSERIFLDPVLARQVARALPGATSYLTYLVNGIRLGEKETPYSFIAGTDDPVLTGDLGPNEIAVSAWLADDLGIRQGDSVALRYYIVGPLRTLQETVTDFTVAAVLPEGDNRPDRDMMPDFPDLAGTENCTDWNPGIPVDTGRIREKDESYWDRYGGTPKAFLRLDTARDLWRNRFGDTTAIRIPAGSPADRDAVRTHIADSLGPEHAGLAILPVRGQGLQAGADSVDFGQLFLGLSFFIIASALLLTALFFSLGIELRTDEIRTLLATGFRIRDVRMLMMLEGVPIALLGSAAGAAAGLLYNRLVIAALAGVWRGSTGTSALVAAHSPGMLGVGFAATAVVSSLTVTVMAHRTAKRIHRAPGARGGAPASRIRLATVVGIACVAAACLLALTAEPSRGKSAAGVFFGAGGLLLVGALALAHAVLAATARRVPAEGLGKAALGIRNIVRRPSRSLTVIGVLASAVFLIVAVGANRHGPGSHPEDPSSGTGGYRYFMEFSMPLVRDLETAKGRAELGIDETVFGGTAVLQCPATDGDDASCLNLNRAATPRILGVDPDTLGKRGSFSFASRAPGTDPTDPWRALNEELPDGTIPAVADQTVILWGLGKKIGDVITVPDEFGGQLRLRLVGGIGNSVLQGNLLISVRHFRRFFPSSGGTRILLIDAPTANAEAVRDELERALRDFGPQTEACTERLAAFNTVENTYLAIFLALGGLGLLIGTAGLAVVVFRNIIERRGELALLRAVGFSRSEITRMLLGEHLLLPAAGIPIGTVAALIAILPAVAEPGGDAAPGAVAAWLAAVFASSMVWVYAAARMATSGELLPALRDE